MRAIDLDGFGAKFAGSDDPWATFSSRDEAVKRQAILRALGAGPLGRVLELAAGNGSNSAAIAPRARRLDATEGTREGTLLTARALAPWPRARASQMVLPGAFPQPAYDAIVVAELLYYLPKRDMARLARDTAALLAPGGRLVLAHHRIDFYDFRQHADGIHRRFLAATRRGWGSRIVARTSRWQVLTAWQAGQSDSGEVRRPA